MDVDKAAKNLIESCKEIATDQNRKLRDVYGDILNIAEKDLPEQKEKKKYLVGIHTNEDIDFLIKHGADFGVYYEVLIDFRSYKKGDFIINIDIDEDQYKEISASKDLDPDVGGSYYEDGFYQEIQIPEFDWGLNLVDGTKKLLYRLKNDDWD